ncbi:hypothetical protein M1D55_19545 [Cupriavidus sp. JZ107]
MDQRENRFYREPQPSAQQAEQRDYRKELAEALGYPDGLRGGKPIGLAWELLIGYVKDMREYAERVERQAEQPAEEARGVDRRTIDPIIKDLLVAGDLLSQRWKAQNKAVSRRLVEHAETLLALLSAPAAGTEQEPVAYMRPDTGAVVRASQKVPGITLDDFSVPLVPQTATGAQGLTDQDAWRMLVNAGLADEAERIGTIRAGRIARAVLAQAAPADQRRDQLAALVDIYDDAINNPPGHRTYVDGAFQQEMDKARAALAASKEA